MGSSQNCLKSLKDTLLEYSVLNMDLLIDHANYSLAEIPIFPSHLFDEILEKSKYMCWKIDTKWYFIASRERLKWSESSLFGLADSLKNVAFGTQNLKTLKINIHLREPKDINIFREIAKSADTIENLHLSVEIFHKFEGVLKNYCSAHEIELAMASCKPLRLKRLSLSVDFFWLFPFSFLSDELTVFELYGCTLTRPLLAMLTRLKRLVHLSLCHYTLEGATRADVLDATTTLTGLRSFALDDVVDESSIDDILNSSTRNLDVLEFYAVVLQQPDRPIARPARKLEVLNYHRLHCFSTEASVPALTGLARRIGNLDDVKGVMTVLSTTPSKFFFSKAVERLFQLVRGKSTEIEMPTRAEMTDMFKFRSFVSVADDLCLGSCWGNSDEVLLKLACYGVNNLNVSDNKFLKEWIENFVEHNEKTHLAKSFSKLI